jgi:G3E family GTPase
MTLFLPPEGESRLPGSLITGFLGSGKTTLLNRLLRHAEMARTAIVINEFGDVALDQVFVERSEGEVAVLANGCLCCAAQEDFEGVVGTLFAKRTRKEVPAFDRMVIETSGLADPGPIMQMLLNQPLITDNFRLDTVVATVDALHAASQLREHEIAVNQVALSDRLVITKTDLADAAKLKSLIEVLASVNPCAVVMRAAEDEIRPSVVFGADHTRLSPLPPRHSHAHAHDIQCFSLSIDESVEYRSFTTWLNALKIRYAGQLLRVKGIVHVAGEHAPIAIHGVHHVFHPPMHICKNGMGEISQLVFITRGLARETVETEFRSRVR